MIEDYAVISADSTTALADIVKGAMVGGLQPLGSVAVCYRSDTGTVIYTQTMVKYSAESAVSGSSLGPIMDELNKLREVVNNVGRYVRGSK